MKYLISLLIIPFLYGCSKKVGVDYNKYNGFYYMHSTLFKFKEYGLENGLEFQYLRFNQENSKFSAINYKTNTVIDFLVEINNRNELVLKMNKDIFFKFEDENRGDRKVVKVTFYKISEDIENSFFTYGYMEEDIQSISDMQKRIAERKEENKIFEENLPPGQE